MTIEPTYLANIFPESWDPALTEIFVDGIKVSAQLGVYQHEKGRRQPLIISASAWARVDVARDDYHDTVDYNLFGQTAQSVADSRHFELVETFVSTLADQLMMHEKIQALRLRAVKPMAIPESDGAGVSIFRRR